MRTEEYAPNENTRLNFRNKMELSNLPDEENRVMIIKTLMGLKSG